jgi:hypothetical protein
VCFIRGGAFANQLGSCSQFSAVSYPSVQLERTIAARYGASQPNGESLNGFTNGHTDKQLLLLDSSGAGDSDTTTTAAAAATAAGAVSDATTGAATAVDDDDGAWLGSE